MAILYWLDFTMFPLFTALGLWFATPYTSLTASFLLAGYIGWVLFEYLLHRWGFHDRRSPYWRSHMVHHRSVWDEAGMPSPFTSWVGFAFWALWATQVFGHQLGWAWWVGFAFGYQSYIWSHHAVHAGWLHGFAVADRHELHHRGWAFNYNLLCPLGDLVFGTYKRSVKK